MTTNDFSPDDAAEVERTIAEIDRESERVGVDWTRVAEALLAARPELGADLPEAPDDAAIGLDALTLLPILRDLPDGAGTDAFLRALDASGPSAEPPVA